MKRRIIPILYISLTITLLASCLTTGKQDAGFQDQEKFIHIRASSTRRTTFPFSGIFFGLTSDFRGPALGLRFSRGSLEALVGEVELTSTFLPALQFQGTLSAYGPAELVLEVYRVRIFDNWNNGWLEGEAEAYGTFLFRRYYLTWRGEVRDPLGIGEIKSGEVRYFDRYYRNDEGTVRVQIRVEKLKEFIENLRVGRNLPVSGDGSKARNGASSTSMIGQPGALGTPSTPESLLRTLPSQFLKEKEVEESPGLFVSLYNLPLINQRFLEKESLIIESE